MGNQLSNHNDENVSNPIIYPMFLIFILFHVVAADSCPSKHSVVSCDFLVPKNPLADMTFAYYGGFSFSQCVTKIEDFKWDIGVYCDKSFFCGLGFNFDAERLTESVPFWTRPVDDTCSIILNKHDHDCDSIQKNLYKAGILRGTPQKQKNYMFKNFGNSKNCYVKKWWQHVCRMGMNSAMVQTDEHNVTMSNCWATVVTGAYLELSPPRYCTRGNVEVFLFGF